MFWPGELLARRMILTLGLFLIGSLHTVVFAIFQNPKNFLMGHESLKLSLICKAILYFFAISISLSHQLLCRSFGLRKTLYFGLVCNCFGLASLILNRWLSPGEGIILLIVLDMVLFGMALTSVVNALVTYMILEFPNKIGMGIVALFIFFNAGSMSAPILTELFESFHAAKFLNLFLMALVCLSIWFVHVCFFNPPISPEKIHLKSAGIIWKELHYRLAFFVIAIIAYGCTESTFNLWGYVQIKDLFQNPIADEVIPFFWMFLILGQICLLVPLHFLPAKRVFYFFWIVVAAASFFFPVQQKLSGFIVWLMVAGFGCSAVFPILLDQLEREILPLAQGSLIYPYIEKSISLMIAGYILGVGIIDLWVQIFGNHPYFSLPAHFHMAALAILTTGALSIFLDATAPKTSY